MAYLVEKVAEYSMYQTVCKVPVAEGRMVRGEQPV